MKSKETIISPLKSSKKTINFITLISIWLFIISIIGIITGGIKIILFPVLIFTFFTSIYCLIRKNKIKKAVYLLKNDKLYHSNNIIKLSEVTHKLDKHNNLILLKDDKKILKISRLSYNFEILLNYFKK